MMRYTAQVLNLLLAASISSIHLVAGASDNWPQFRGSRGGVAADDPSLPETWSATDNIVWKASIPGRGWSSPIVWGDHVFVTAAVNATGTEEPLKPVPSYAGRSVGGPMSGRDIGSSTDPHRWVLYDIEFKTGKVYPEHATQLRLYALAGFIMHPEATEARAENWYLDGAPSPLVGYVAQRSALEGLKREFTEFARPLLNDDLYPATPGRHCNWCGFAKSKGGPCDFG